MADCGVHACLACTEHSLHYDMPSRDKQAMRAIVCLDWASVVATPPVREGAPSRILFTTPASRQWDSKPLTLQASTSRPQPPPTNLLPGPRCSCFRGNPRMPSQCSCLLTVGPTSRLEPRVSSPPLTAPASGATPGCPLQAPSCPGPRGWACAHSPALFSRPQGGLCTSKHRA